MEEKTVLKEERNQTDKELSAELFGMHTVNMTANLIFKHNTLTRNLREKSSISYQLQCT